MVRRIRVGPAVAFLALCLCPGMASGSFIARDSKGVLSLIGTGTEKNVVAVSLSAGTYTVTDQAGITPAGSPCAAGDATPVPCPAAQVVSLFASLAAGDDSWTSTAPVPASVQGGDNDDTITGGSADDQLAGGVGDDKLYGGGGNDQLAGEFVAGDSTTGTNLLDGGDGNDTLSGGGGTDTIVGGPGDDTETGYAGNDSADGGDGTDTIS